MDWRESSEENFPIFFFSFFNHFLSPLINFIFSIAFEKTFFFLFLCVEKSKTRKSFIYKRRKKERMKEVELPLVKSKVGKQRRRPKSPRLNKRIPIFYSQCRVSLSLTQTSVEKNHSFHQSVSETNFHSLNCAIERLHARRFLLRMNLSAIFKVTRPRIFLERWRRLNWNSIARENQQISLKIFFVLVLLLILHCHFNFRWRNHANKALENVRSTFFFVSRLRLKVTINEVLQYFCSLLFYN